MRALAVTVGCGAALAAAADCPEASLQSAFRPRTRLCEHPWVICQRLWLPYHDPLELRMLRIEQEVVLMRGERSKSTRLNSSHVKISYAVFCLKEKTVFSVAALPGVL